MRWNNTISLLSHPASYQDDMGMWHEGDNTSREVFCNEFAVGANTYNQALTAGLRADIDVQLRAIDYEDEPEAVYNGVEYTVHHVTRKGEYIRLQLGKKVSNEHIND